MKASKAKIRYRSEVIHPRKVDGEYLVSVRDNDEARLILGLEIGREYTYQEVVRAYILTLDELKKYRSPSKADGYRIISAKERLISFDPMVF